MTSASARTNWRTSSARRRGNTGSIPRAWSRSDFPNGANIAAATLLLRPGTLRGAVLWRAMVPFTPATLPELGGTNVLLAAGAHDPLVPRENTERLAALLRGGGADLTLTWADVGHQLTSAEVTDARRWLADLR